MADPAPQKLGRYVLLDKIAAGGMAEVYRAKLIGIEGFEKDVAIKRILPHWSQDRNFVEMLVDEAKVLVHLNHANIVSVYELNKDDETYFIVMEYVSGMDLRRFIQQRLPGQMELPLPLALYITRSVLEGLAYAHDKKDREARAMGIVHRDISPQNILLSADGAVKLTDFGIARVFGKSTETVTGTLKGKFAYMSPEQAIGQKVDWRTDLFAMGIVLYELATGQRCFKGQNDFETLELVRHVSVSLEATAKLPLEFVRILLKSLEKEKDDRYQSAREMLQDLQQFELSEGLKASAADLRDALSPCIKTQPAQSSSENILTMIRPEAQTERHTRVLVSSPVLPHPDYVPTLVDQSLKTKRPVLPMNLILFVLVPVLFLVIVAGFWIFMPSKNAAPVVAPVPVPIAPLIPVSVPEPVPVPEPVIAKPEPPQEPKPQVFGGLSVSAQPWGIVSISGIVSGVEAPVTRSKIAAGNYTVRVTYPPLAKTVSTSVRIGENSLVRCQAVFAEPARINCH